MSASEPQSERVLDRPAHQADLLNTTNTSQSQPVSNLDESAPSTQHEGNSSIENPIALRPITVMYPYLNAIQFPFVLFLSGVTE